MEVNNSVALGIYLQAETNTVDVKKEVIDTEYCQHMDIQHTHHICSNSNYTDTGISDTHVASVKSEPEDEPPGTSDHSKFIIEIDTCKDEYYEHHGYPSNTANANLEEVGVEQESGEDYVTKKDVYVEHSDTHHQQWVPHTDVDPKPCTVVLIDIQYAYPDIVTHGSVRVHHKEPTIKIQPESTQYVPALHQSKHKPYWCSVCGVSFMHKCHLNTHMRIHTGEKPHKCSVCEGSFTQKSYLARHMRTHTGEKPYTCTICGVDFSEKCNLASHLRTHTGNKPHKCSVCGVGFSRTDGRKKHTRIHTGEKPHTCSVCEVSFTEKWHLTRHMRIHTGEKPHTCFVCGVGYSRKDGVKEHMRIHTGETPYECDICGVSFTRKSTLTQHMRIHT